jgi:hypothetical protein
MQRIFDDEQRRNGAFFASLSRPAGAPRLLFARGPQEARRAERPTGTRKGVGPKSPLTASKMLESGPHFLALFSLSGTVLDTNAFSNPC